MLSTVCWVAGLALIALAAYLVYPPAGIAVAGMALVLTGYALDRRPR